jgi:hypothetical protein
MGRGEKAGTLQKLHNNKSRTNAHNVLERSDVQLLVAKCEYCQPLNTHSTKYKSSFQQINQHNGFEEQKISIQN